MNRNELQNKLSQHGWTYKVVYPLEGFPIIKVTGNHGTISAILPPHMYENCKPCLNMIYHCVSQSLRIRGIVGRA